MGKIFVKHFGFLEDNEENRKLLRTLTPQKEVKQEQNDDTTTKKSNKKIRPNVKRVSLDDTPEQLDDNIPTGTE